MAFQFPATPTDLQIVPNPITGSNYQWRADLSKWVIIASGVNEYSDIIHEGPTPPVQAPNDPIKLWYSTDTLELYFYYCDVNDVCAWVPTSKPITMLEDLDNTVFELRSDLTATNVAVRENENRIGRTIQYSDTAPTIFPEEEYDGEFFFNELNYKFWYDTSRLELLVLYKDPDDGAYSYVPVSLPLTNLDLDALNTQVQANSYSNNQQSQALVTLEQLIFERATTDYVDNKIADLQEQINALTEIVKGNVSRYTVANNIGTPVSRPGEISCNAGYWSSLNRFSFGTADANGTTTPAMSNDDIIEIYDAAEGDTSRYRITNASGAPTLVEVEYISGKLFVMPNAELEVRIY